MENQFLFTIGSVCLNKVVLIICVIFIIIPPHFMGIGMIICYSVYLHFSREEKNELREQEEYHPNFAKHLNSRQYIQIQERNR